MGPTDQNKELLNEPDEEQGAEPQTSELGDGGNEEGDTVDVFGADDDAETTGNQMSDDDGDLDTFRGIIFGRITTFENTGTPTLPSCSQRRER